MKVKQLYIFSLAVCFGLLTSCKQDPKSPGRVYFPDMGYSQAYETYAESPVYDDGRASRLPVTGTIPRGTFETFTNAEEAHHYSYLASRYFTETPDGYEKAGAELKNPVKLTDAVLKEGEKIYTIYCAVCHGATGDGQGSIVTSGAYPPVPGYKDRLPTINEGKMFHAITFGRNLMGGYSSQVTAEERWKVIYYIQKLAEVGQFAGTTAQVDTTSAK